MNMVAFSSGDLVQAIAPLIVVGHVHIDSSTHETPLLAADYSSSTAPISKNKLGIIIDGDPTINHDLVIVLFDTSRAITYSSNLDIVRRIDDV